MKILKNLIINKNNILFQEIADQLNISKRTIRRDIEKLKQQNKLKRIGNEKTGYWKIMIWITNKLSKANNPYGDGKASERILKIIRNKLLIVES